MYGTICGLISFPIDGGNNWNDGQEMAFTPQHQLWNTRLGFFTFPKYYLW